MPLTRDPAAERDELRELRDSVSCAVVLEREGFRLDVRESSRRSQKYRSSDKRAIIVNHDGRGWWDPHDSLARGDVFKLVQYLHPGTNLGQVRQQLRAMMGMTPSHPLFLRPPKLRSPPPSVAVRWTKLPSIRPGSLAWIYLSEARALPASVLHMAAGQDVLREGLRGTACFLHRDSHGTPTTFEMRGPSFRGCAKDSSKALFRFAGGNALLRRVAVTEAAIDALSLASMEGLRDDTLYLSTAGGAGPEGLATLGALLKRYTDIELMIAVDRGAGGERLAATLGQVADEVQVRRTRLLPPQGAKDWNEALCDAGEQ